MSSLAALTSSEREQLVHFQAVVNMSDAEQALSILRNHSWVMEDAVANALIMSPSSSTGTSSSSSTSSSLSASQSTAPLASAPPPLNTSSASLSSNYAAVSPASSPTRSLLSSSSSSSLSASSSATTSTPTRSARAPATLTWNEWLSSLPFGWLLTSAITFCSQLLAAVLPSTLWNGPAAAPPTVRHAPPSTSASALVASWLQQWPHSPPFVTHSYLTAVRECKAQHKLLFLYLHHPAVRTGDGSFVASTLCSEAMHNFVEQNFIAWMGSAQSGDGARLASTLRVRSYPFVALLAPVNNQLAVMYRREGETAASGSTGSNEADDMIHAMLLKLEQYEAMTAGERRAEEERREGRTLRDQQDREYQEALEKDREQQRKKDREAEQKKIAEEEQQARVRAVEEEKLRKERREQERLARRHRLLESLPPEPAAGGAAVVTVSVRLVAGKKISRRWEDSTVMDRLFDWIDGQPQQVGQAGDADVVRAKAGGGTRVVSNFPRKIHTDGSATVKSLGLGKQILLMVEPVDDADDTQH